VGRSFCLILNLKYKSYWRKSGLKGYWGNVLFDQIKEHCPKNFLEIGVFCGVTARNVCDLLHSVHGNNFNYVGLDLFGGKKDSKIDEIEPNFLKRQKFSNPFKNIYYNVILKENLNSLESVSRLLDKYKGSVELIKGDTNTELRKIDLSKIDFAFVDGGHSYKTTLNDLNILYKNLKNKKKILLCDDYGEESCIDDVRRAVDDFTQINNLKKEIIRDRFVKITT
jgi:hypothetical protein